MNKRPDFGIIDFDKIRKKKKRELTDLEKQEIHEAFKLFDTDNDDKINYNELKVALRALGFEVKKPDVQKLMADYDEENTGKITVESFNEIGILLLPSYIIKFYLNYYIAKGMILDRDPQEDMRRAFRLFSEESSGQISFRTLRKIAKYTLIF